MKVVLACNFPRDERLGSARVPLRLAVELRALGVDVSLVFSENLRQVGSGRVEQLSAPWRMKRALIDRARDADVVDIAGGDAWVYERFARRRRPSQALISRSNGLWDRALAADGLVEKSRVRALLSNIYQQQLVCRWERASIVSSDIVVFGSSDDGDEVVRRGWKSADGVAVVAPGIDDDGASPMPLDQRQDVAFVGTFFHRKGNDIVGAAMSQVMKARPTVRMTFFAPGVPDSWVLDAFDASVRSRVTIRQALPAKELARELGSFAVLVFPTRYEGFGLVVLEAMRAGLAVVTTPTGAGKDVVRDGVNGLVVPIGDVAATAAAVTRLIDDAALRVRIAEAAVEEARGRLWSRTASELLSVYERARLIAARRR
jgi:glycosyltransferase involved in cell wall biosynthesis